MTQEDIKEEVESTPIIKVHSSDKNFLIVTFDRERSCVPAEKLLAAATERKFIIFRLFSVLNTDANERILS